jgi:integrase
VWRADQIQTFLAAVQHDRFAALFLSELTTGIRRGQVCGLKWTSVDLESGEIAVHDNRVVVGGHARDKAGGKTKNADQTISIDRATVAALRRWAHGAGRRASVLRWRLSPRRQRVHLRGRPPAPPRHDQAAFRRPRSSRRLSRITFHDLRHSYATGAVKADINPKVVASGLDTQMSGTSCRPMRMSSQMMTAKLLSRRPHPDRQRVGNVRRRRQFRWLAKLMFPNAFPSGMKMTPEVGPLGSFYLVAGTGFAPATSGL